MENSLPPIWAKQLQTPHVQNRRFDACLRVVHKAEAAITCHHTQLGALLKRAAGAIYFKETVNVCDSSCALGCFRIACLVQMFTDPRHKVRTGRQALFYRDVLCMAVFRSEKQQVVTGQREGRPPTKSHSWRCMQKYATSGVDLTSGSPYHQANLPF